jgi:hypothetical protein
MNLMEKKMGTMAYLDLYNNVRSHVMQVRQARKQQQVLEVRRDTSIDL